MQFRSDGYLNNLTAWARGSSPSGINVITRSGNKFLHKREHDSAGSLSMGDDGRIYSSSGKIFTSDLVESGNLQGQALYPGIGGSLYIGLRLNDGTITVYESGKTTPICKWGRFPGWPKKDRSSSQDWRHQRDGIPFDKRIIFIPHHNRIIFFPPENDRIVLKRFDLEATLQDAGVDYLFVTSVPQRCAGARQAWSYQVEALSGAGEMQYQLELGPRGMQVSPEGLLTWKVPGKIAQTREKVVLLITDGSGEQTYHSFWIEVQGDVVISDDGEKETASGRVHQFDYETR